MQNLAGHERADDHIKVELERARIPIIAVAPSQEEVSYSHAGRLGDFVLKRAWAYWVAKGFMPIETAEELYIDPVGKTDIRVAGHAGAPAPSEWAKWITPDGKIVRPKEQEAKFLDLFKQHEGGSDEKFIFSDDPESLDAKQYIDTYHIDTEVGLRVFADLLHTLKADQRPVTA